MASTALRADLRDRGLRTERAVLVVIDGAKALAKAVRNVFGSRALVQRCQAHYADLRIMPMSAPKFLWGKGFVLGSSA